MVRWAMALMCCAVMAAMGWGQVPPSPGQEASPAEKPKQSIQGKVVDARSGEPIRKVNVQITGRSAEGPGNYSMMTGADGGFAFDGVGSGRYIVTLQRSGYVQMGSRMADKTLLVEGGRSLTGVVLRMQPAGIITGKIVDPDGDPVANVSVLAIAEGPRSMMAGGERSGSGTTNDLGEYRIAELRPGKYLVLAQPTRQRPIVNEQAGQKSKERLIEAATYYPGTADKGQGVAVQVRGGEEVAANFGIVTSRAYTVSGVVVGAPSGALVQQLMLEAKSGGHEVMNGGSQSLGEGGRFEYSDLLPGTYQATMVSIKGPLTGGIPAFQILELSPVIEVERADVEGLQLKVVPGGKVRGKFRLDSGEKFDWKQLGVSVRAVQEGGAANASWMGTFALAQGGATAEVNTDGSFEISNVPTGNYELVVTARGIGTNQLADYYTKAVMFGGNDVADSGFAVGGNVFLDVVISAKGATLEGTVIDSKGQAVPDGMVVVPNTEKRARADSYQQQATDGQGHFVMKGLTPGKYVVLGFDELADDYRAPGFLKMYAGKGEAVELEEGGKKSVTTKVIVAEGEQ